MTKYPDGLDTDVEIPRVDDNITEIGGDAINSLRDAVFAIEKTLGEKLHGSATDLVSRLSVSLDAAGNIKAVALASAGLVTLPIDNDDVGIHAGIEESKLDLDHSTSSLQTVLDSLTVYMQSIEQSLILDIGNLTQHVAHPSAYGRHTASDIDIAEVSSSFNGDTTQQAIDVLDSNISNHINDIIDAHDASAISFDPSSVVSITDDNVQSAIETLEKLEMRELTKHRDNQHSNGILQRNNVTLLNSTHSTVILSSANIIITLGEQSVIKYVSAPSALDFAEIQRNDRIDIVINGETYTRVVKDTESTNRILIYGYIPTYGSGAAEVYKNQEETSAPSVFKVAIRNSNRSIRPSMLQIVHPDAAFIIGNRERGLVLDSTHKNLKFGYSTGNTGDIDIYTLMLAFSSVRSTWTVSNIAKVLNEEVFAPIKVTTTLTHYPLIAFEHNGELGVACDDNNNFLEILTPSTQSANDILGFVDGQKEYSHNYRNIYEDGYEYNSVRTLLDSYAVVDTPDTLRLLNTDLTPLGLSRNSLIHLSDGYTGTFVTDNFIVSGNDTLIQFDSTNELGGMTVGVGVQVKIYADFFSLHNQLSKRTFYELCTDGYDGYSSVEFQPSVRVEYKDTSGGGATLEDVLDVTGVSRTLSESSLRVFYDYSTHTLALGEKGSGVTVINQGTPITVPSPSSNEEGFNVRLYDSYNVDYIELEIINGLPSSNGTLDIDIYDALSEEHFIQIGTILNDKNTFSRLSDTRLFGSISRYDIRDDFIRDYIDYPRSLLRGNGIIRGFAIDGSAGDSSIIINGGEALVNGSVKEVLKKEFFFPDVSETYNIFIDSAGSLCMEVNNFYTDEILVTSTTNELVNSTTKTIIARITSDASYLLNTVEDFRRFVGNIDNKLDLIVEENTITHSSFASLKAAFNWITAHDSLGLPVSRIVKVRGRVNVDLSEGSINIPDGVILRGDTLSSAGQSSRSELLLSGTISGTLFNVSGSFSLINLAIRMDSTVSLNRFISNDSTGIVSDIFIKNCEFYNIISGCLIEAGAILDCNIISTKITTSSSYSDDLIKSIGVVDNLFVEKCNVDFLSTSSAISFINIETLQNSIISNSIITGTATANLTYGLIINTKLSNSIIKNCIFNNIYNVSIYVSEVEKTIIKNNIFSNVGTNGSSIYFYTSASKSFIIDNIFNTSIDPLYFIYINDGNDISIMNNKMSSGISTTGVNGTMIYFSNTSNNILINNNTLLNSTGNNKGFEDGIYFDGAAGNIALDNNNIFITENIITEFYSATSHGLYVINGNVFKIINNNILSSYQPLYLYDCQNTHIKNNFLDSGTLSALKPCLTIDGSSPLKGENLFVITDNIFYYYGSSVLPMASAVVLIQNLATTGGYITQTGVGIFSNNLFFISAFNSSLPALDMDASADNFQVTNNVFWSSVGYLLVTFTNPIISVLGDDCFVSLNNITHINYTGSGTAITVTGSRSTEELNKGNSYINVLPISSAILTSTPSTSWVYINSFGYDRTYVVTTAANDLLYFDLNNILDGSTVTSLNLYYNIVPGSATGVTIQGIITEVFKSVDTSFITAPATVSFSFTPVLSAATYLTNITIPSFEVKKGAVYSIEFDLQVVSGAITSFAIMEASVNYTL